MAGGVRLHVLPLDRLAVCLRKCLLVCGKASEYEGGVGNRLDIVGTTDLTFTILGVERSMKVLVAQGTPIRELIVGWKTLIHWGLFTLASLQPTPPSYSEAQD